MSNSEKPAKATIKLTGAMVAEYLRMHPDYFEQYPELLARLNVPHVSGGAVSLIERQVSLLREQNAQTRKRLKELIGIARHNEETAARMHQLALRLMDSAEPKDIFATLYENLKSVFKADRVAVRLFARPAFVDSYPGEEFVDPGANEVNLFRSIISKGSPLSGNLKRQQQVFLFGDDGDDIASAVMVPLSGPGWGGVLAIGSVRSDRYEEGMGVELLRNMGEVLSIILKPWILET